MPLNCKPIKKAVINYYTRRLFEEKTLADSFVGFIELLKGKDEYQIKKEILIRTSLLGLIFTKDFSTHSGMCECDALTSFVGAIYTFKNDIIKISNPGMHSLGERIKLIGKLLKYQERPGHPERPDALLDFYSLFLNYCFPDLFPFYNDHISVGALEMFRTHPKIASRYPLIPKIKIENSCENYLKILKFYNFLIINCFTDLDEVGKECESIFKKRGLNIKLSKLRMLDKYFIKQGWDVFTKKTEKKRKWVELVVD